MCPWTQKQRILKIKTGEQRLKFEGQVWKVKSQAKVEKTHTGKMCIMKDDNNWKSRKTNEEREGEREDRSPPKPRVKCKWRF